MPEALILYVSTKGKDAWNGLAPDRVAGSPDGPLATLEGARSRLLHLRGLESGIESARILVRGGRYAFREPLRFSPEDSFPACYEACPGETPVLHGCRLIDNWSAGLVHGKDCLVADVSRHLQDHGPFRTLFVNGVRRPRSRYPKEGTLAVAGIPGRDEGNHIYGGARDYFEFGPGALPEWDSFRGAEVVARHLWLEERLPVAGIDHAHNRLRSTRRSVFALDCFGETADFWIENIFAELSEPGEWYLDLEHGRLYYLPVEGESALNLEAEVPVLTNLVRFDGEPEHGRLVTGISLHGLTFRGTDWSQFTDWGVIHDPDALPGSVRQDPAAFNVPGFSWDGRILPSGVPQAAANLAGTIQYTGTADCRLMECTIHNVGFWAVRVGEGCRNLTIAGNRFVDTGAGGVLVSGGGAQAPRASRCRHIRIRDNEISRGGRIFLSAVGVAVTHGREIEISRNHIHDYFYTGISAGWTWGYVESATRDIVIEGNHIHHIGCGFLSDMGAVYTLGIQPGTVIRGNLVHDVRSRQYGGWGIYLDEGSSRILVEGNVIFDTDCSALNIHYGKDNLFRHNLCAMGGEGLVSVGRAEHHVAGRFERNVLIARTPPFFWQGYAGNLMSGPVSSDYNLFIQCDRDDAGPAFCCRHPDHYPAVKGALPLASRPQWLAIGNDGNSHFLVRAVPSPVNRDCLAALPDPQSLRQLGIESFFWTRANPGFPR